MKKTTEQKKHSINPEDDIFSNPSNNFSEYIDNFHWCPKNDCSFRLTVVQILMFNHLFSTTDVPCKCTGGKGNRCLTAFSCTFLQHVSSHNDFGYMLSMTQKVLKYFLIAVRDLLDTYPVNLLGYQGYGINASMSEPPIFHLLFLRFL